MRGAARRTADGRGEVLWRPEETAAGVGVYVEDCGGAACVDEGPDEEPAWTYGAPLPRLAFPRTAMPPGISA